MNEKKVLSDTNIIFSTFIVGLRLRTYGADAAHIWC